jgi:hypothetical protein
MRLIRIRWLVAVCALAAAGLSLAGQTSPTAPGARLITTDSLKADTYFLSTPEMAGRGALSVEGRIATNYVASEFMRLGLKPAADGSYFQTFPMASFHLDREKTSLVARWGGAEKTFQFDVDFFHYGQSSKPAAVTAPVVFAGYGATAPEYGYDDFAGLDVKGKIALILPLEPGTDASRFKGRWGTIHAYTRQKIENARRHGVGGLLIVTEWVPRRPPSRPSAPRPSGDLPSFALASQIFDLPVFRITRETANEILKASGKTIEALKDGIDKGGRPASQEVPGVQVTITRATRDRRVAEARNVVGLLEGSDAQLKNEVVTVTAHYDHLGTSGGRIYYGADDDASGTAGVLEIARAFARAETRPKRSILFLVVEAEESGLLGSYQYVATPVVPLDRTVAVLNMDMISRDEESATWNTHAADNRNGVNIVGTLYNPGLRTIIDRDNAAIGLKLDYKTDADDREDWFARSDHFPFAVAGVPQVLFNTGETPDYHTENDTWDRLNFEKMTKIVRLVYLTAWDVANQEERIPFEKD